MRQISKYVLYGTALAGIAGGTITGISLHSNRSVSLEVDAATRTVHTTAHSVRGVLTDAGYQVGSHDIVAPRLDASVADGGRVVLRRGRLLRLTVDGVRRDVWVTAPTVSAALSQLGYSTVDFASVSRARRLPLSPSDIAVRSPRRVTIRHDRTSETVATTAATIRQMLADVGITLGEADKVSVPVTSAPTAGQTVVLTRVRTARMTATESVPYPTTRQSDSSLPWGQTKVITPGKAGSRRVTYDVVYVDEKITRKSAVASQVVAVPVGAVVHVGTAAQTPAEARAAAAQLVAARGWDSSELSCLESLWNKESGWRVDAQNPDGGAYGIPQALPGSKMATVAADWQTNAITQITWGLNYIAGIYGTPCAAWGHSQSVNWY